MKFNDEGNLSFARVLFFRTFVQSGIFSLEGPETEKVVGTNYDDEVGCATFGNRLKKVEGRTIRLKILLGFGNGKMLRPMLSVVRDFFLP